MLQNYSADHFPLLSSWVDSEELLFRFSGPDWSFPLREEQIRDYRVKYPSRYLFVGCDHDGQPYAFGEIITGYAYPPRLGRLLIGDPARRGQGLGGSFIRELIAECMRITGSGQVDLFVLQDNHAAIACYQKIGFGFLPGTYAPLLYKGKEHPLYKMSLHI